MKLTWPGTAGLFTLALFATSSCGDAATPTVGQDVASACVRSAACGIRAYPRVRECMDNYQTENHANGAVYTAIFACVNRAESCLDVDHCYGKSTPCDASFISFCDGATTHTCDLIDRQVYRLDCGSVGGTCQAGTSFSGGCKAGAGSSQVPSLPPLSCPAATCQPVGGSCASDALDRCAGDELEACIDGSWVRFSCEGLGLGVCQTQALGFGRCRRPVL